jgi:hypothetical protein
VKDEDDEVELAVVDDFVELTEKRNRVDGDARRQHSD